MDYEQEKLIYKLYKKGKANLSHLDQLIMEANPEIKNRLSELFGVDQEFYNECYVSIEQTLAETETGETHVKAPHFKIVPLLAISGALVACLLVIFNLVINLSKVPVALGGKVTLFISAAAAPDQFYRTGSRLQTGTELKLAFQAPTGTTPIRQGVLFMVSNTENRVYYRYDGTQDQLKQRERILAVAKLLISGESDYIGFIAYFSGTPFNEQKLVKDIADVIRINKAGAGNVLSAKYKAAAFDYIYLLLEK